MSLNEPKISFIIASRNDNHCGDSINRLAKTLNHLVENFTYERKHFLYNEIILVDWGSETALERVLGGGLKTKISTRFLYIPRDSSGTFNEVLALNVGIRRAKGLYIARLDQDTLPGFKFREWLKELPDQGYAPAYFSERRELGVTNPLLIPVLEPRFHKRWSAGCPLGDWPETYNQFYKAAVGVVLAPRSEWHKVRGYDERMVYRNHMEHDLCVRFRKACGLVNLGPIVDYDFYHQWHEPVQGRKSNLQPSDDFLNELPIFVNDENWGMAKVKLEERYL